MANRVKISYNGTLLENVDYTENFTLLTSGKLMDGDVVVEAELYNSTSPDVIFIDYDGTILHEYTQEKFLELESLPANPTHQGLTAQGWNWDLEEAQSYVEKYGKLEIGQTYITDDGKTRLYVTLTAPRLHPYVGFGINGTATIDWGDGNTSTVTGNDVDTLVSGDHEYSQAGEYVIAIDGNIKILATESDYCALYTGNLERYEADAYSRRLVKVEFGNIADTIDEYAFCACSNLALITIPKGVKYFSEGVFESCDTLKAVVFPKGTLSIGELEFDCCYSVIYVSIPNTVENIDDEAFEDCYSLKRASIPESATSLGDEIFIDCYSLESVSLPDTGMTTVGSSFCEACYRVKTVFVPEGVTEIGAEAFKECYDLKSVSLPSTLTSIGKEAFKSCDSLESIVIPEGVTTIGEEAFSECRALKSVSLPSTLTSMGKHAFYNTRSLESVVISEGVTNISEGAFEGCQVLKSVSLPSTLTSIGKYAFQGIGTLKELNIPSGVTSIGDYAFSGTVISSIVFPSSVTIISLGMFYNNYNLDSVIIPEGVITIGSNAFFSCEALQNITIPSSVTSIGSGAFSSCGGLGEIHFKSTTPPTLSASSAFSSLPTDCKIYVPSGSLSAYTSAQYYPNSSTYTYIEE